VQVLVAGIFHRSICWHIHIQVDLERSPVLAYIIQCAIAPGVTDLIPMKSQHPAIAGADFWDGRHAGSTELIVNIVPAVVLRVCLQVVVDFVLLDGSPDLSRVFLHDFAVLLPISRQEYIRVGYGNLIRRRL
jgi:hypothetical protein